MPNRNYRGKNHHLYKHGYASTKVYDAWKDMMRRCYDSSNDRYKWYGARGIKVQESWHKFENFLRDMGIPSKGLSLDRIDVNGDYTKDNCRWTDKKTQMNNMRSNRFVIFEGITKTVAGWAEFLGINNRSVFASRISRGQSLAQAACIIPKYRYGSNLKRKN